MLLFLLLVTHRSAAIKMDAMEVDEAHTSREVGGANGDAPDEGGNLFSVVHPSASHAPQKSSGKAWCADVGLAWCESWSCGGEAWCKDGARPSACNGCCLSWCETWSCGGEAWCQAGAKPAPCVGCCPRWCDTWTCGGEAWCLGSPTARPEPCKPCFPGGAGANGVGAAPGAGDAATGTGEAPAFGPISSVSPRAGWVVDHGHVSVSGAGFDDGSVTISGDTRAYLVEDYTRSSWRTHKYSRVDLSRTQPLTFRVDLSNVPCGCLACVYLVAMNDPSAFRGSNYCDMGGVEGTKPCLEVDLFEANDGGLQSALHTEPGGSFGTNKCDRIGCFARSGGDNAPEARRNAYGPGKTIDSARPFEVRASVDAVSGALMVLLTQGDAAFVSFDRHIAGNPQGSGVPTGAMEATKSALQSLGGLALVASLWTADDLSWLTGRTCDRKCDVNSASFTISKMVMPFSTPAPPPLPLPPPFPMPPPPPPRPPRLPVLNFATAIGAGEIGVAAAAAALVEEEATGAISQQPLTTSSSSSSSKVAVPSASRQSALSPPPRHLHLYASPPPSPDPPPVMSPPPPVAFVSHITSHRTFAPSPPISTPTTRADPSSPALISASADGVRGTGTQQALEEQTLLATSLRGGSSSDDDGTPTINGAKDAGEGQGGANGRLIMAGFSFFIGAGLLAAMLVRRRQKMSDVNDAVSNAERRGRRRGHNKLAGSCSTKKREKHSRRGGRRAAGRYATLDQEEDSLSDDDDFEDVS